MKPAHSPAPWRVTDPEDGSGELVIVSRPDTADAEDIAAVSLDRPDLHPNQRANAELMAAAPDLLAACVAIAQNPGARNRVRRDLLDAVDAAIAKATGATVANLLRELKSEIAKKAPKCIQHVGLRSQPCWTCGRPLNEHPLGTGEVAP